MRPRAVEVSFSWSSLKIHHPLDLTVRRDKLFVYGTLKRGESRHEVLRPEIDAGQARLVETAVVPGFELYDMGEFPVAVPGDGRIEGEIYELPHELLIGELDRIEGFPHGFDRKQVEVDGHTCWIYYSDDAPPGGRHMTDTNWST